MKAFNAIQVMKEFDLTLQPFHYPGLIRTYSYAIRLPVTSQKMARAYIQDTWVLFQDAVQQGYQSNYLLNALLEAHVNIGDIEAIEGQVLPLFKELGIKETPWTYRNVLVSYAESGLFGKVIKVYETLKNQPELLHRAALHTLLASFIELKDPDRILEVLEIYKSKDILPRKSVLKRMGGMGNIPDDLLAVLSTYDE